MEVSGCDIPLRHSKQRKTLWFRPDGRKGGDGDFKSAPLTAVFAWLVRKKAGLLISSLLPEGETYWIFITGGHISLHVLAQITVRLFLSGSKQLSLFYP